MSGFRILIADSDPLVRKSLRDDLKSANDEIFLASSRAEALQIVERESLDLIITDIMLPDVEICRDMRQRSAANIIVTSAAGENEKYQTQCLKAGAARFLPKPFTSEELKSCLEPIIRQKQSTLAEGTSNKNIFKCGNLKIAFAQRRITLSEQDIKLTPTEFSILEQLAVNAGKVITHTTLINKIWGNEYSHEREYLRIFVNRLRRKLEADPTNPKLIITLPWIGYKLNVPESDPEEIEDRNEDTENVLVGSRA
jgi:two-component system, OmpR family, KDP operon response regulator KdpE